MTIVTVGIDLAKNVFAVHGVGDSGKPELVRPEVPRAKLLELIAGLPPLGLAIRTLTGMISFLKCPLSIAATARWWLRSANAS